MELKVSKEIKDFVYDENFGRYNWTKVLTQKDCD
jgi:hypothetical protein